MQVMTCLLQLLLTMLFMATVQQVSAQGSVFIVGPTSVTTVFGSEEGLVCAAFLTDGDPDITWSTNATGADLSNVRDVMDLPENVEIVSLNIAVDSGYCGTYTCTEEILSGSFSEQVTVDVAPKITEHPVHTSIGASRLNSDNVSFRCIVSGGTRHPVEITWFGPAAGSPSFNPQPQLPLGNGVVQSTLVLTGVTYNVTGDYWCETRYDNAPGCTETSQSDSATLFIVEAPFLIIEPDPPQLNVTAGTTLSYQCSFNASNDSSRLDFQPDLANFSASWTGPLGATIENTSSYEVLLYFYDEIVNTTLIIINASSSEGGQYSCIAENIDGFDNSTVLLYVDPVIQPINYTVAINDTLTITCDVQDFPAPSFTWQKELNNTFQTLSPQIDTNGRILNTTSKNLTFDPIIFGDEGVYRCVVYTLEFESIPSNEILLTVSPESGVSVSPLNQLLEHDDNITHSCESQGGPGNQFNWTITRNDVIIQGPLSSTFAQSPVTGGVYTCVVSNTAGFGSATTTVFISLRFIVQPNNTQTDVRERAVLICEAESFPEPTYEWFRLDDSIRGNLTGLNASSLVLDSVLFGDEGEYYCSATSRTNFTATSRTAILTVSPRDSVSVSPEAQVANLTDDVSFSCQAKGGPNNTFQWYHDAQILAGETNANITISNISSLDGGAYMCSVMNAAGSENITVTLYVRPYIVLFPETEITTRVNRSINFTCMAQSFPPPFITWFKVNNSSRIIVGTGDVLEFNPVEFGDEGNYECFAMSDVPDGLNSTQASALLTVSPEGSVGVSPVNLVYYFENNVTFSCSFLGGLNNTIQWSKDGLDVNGETQREIVLSEINAGDGGVYTCTVSNSAGRENASTTLFVAPYFIRHPVDVLSENGENVNFSCLAEAFPMPSYAWKRAEAEEIRTEVIGLNSSLLVYTSVLFGDEGVYHCEATILNVTVPSDNATLTLSPDGINVTAMASDEVTFGQSVNLTCDHLGGPGNTYSWLKDGRPLNETDTLLSLANVTAMDGGTYTCVVRNLAGNSNASIIVYIQPYITLFPQELVTADNGSAANISCEADGFPMPNITWIKYESFQNRSDFSEVTRNSVLELEPVLFGNEGFYACVASSRGFDGRQLEDVVTDPPSELAVSPLSSVSIAWDIETYFLGDNTTLSCTSLGGPNNSYAWLYNEEVVGFGPALKLTNISADNGGVYTCIAANNAGNDSAVTDLYVHPYITMAPELNIYTMNGEFISLECIVDGFPAPNVTWKSLGIEIGNNFGMENVSMDGINSNLTAFDNLPLEFSLVTFGDEGYYRCVVSAQTPEGVALETVMSQPTLVTVSPEGSVRVEPEFQVVERFDNITFECFSLGGPNNTYQWQKNTIGLSNETTSILTLSNASAIDGGTYSCVASNAAGNETVDAMLFIRPYITLNPTPDVLSFNSNVVSFDCQAESFPSPRYFWEKVSDNSTIVSEDQELVFAPVTFGVQGVYQCVAYITTNITNLTASSTAALLTVSPDAGVTSMPPLLNSIRNQTIQFLCISFGGPNNSFSWVRLLDQTLLSNSSLLEVSVDGVLSGGEYRCDVSNRAGNGSFQATLNVAPEISEHPAALNVSISGSFSLSCAANGVPTPEIFWLLNGTEVDLLNTTLFSGSGSGSLVPIEVTETYGVRSISSTLDVSMAMTNDSGNYSCLIVSPVADFPPITTDPARVLVQDVPDPPHSLTSLSVTNTSMIVMWVEPHDRNAPISSYTVTYQHPSFLGGQEESVNSGAEMSFIGGLHPGVVYNFSVVAHNEFGVSEPSVVTGLATLDEEPASPPPNLTATVLSSTSVYFTWSELPEIDRNGIITAYEINYTPLVNCSSISPGTRSGFGNSTQLLVDELQENTEYSFRVRAYTSAGPGPYGENVVNNTLEDVPSGPPERVEVNCLSPTELSVLWDSINCSKENGEIFLYQIRYETFNTFGGEITDPVRFINTSNRWVMLSGLEEFNEYHVTIMGYTAIGAGPYSSPQSNTTKENVPFAPPMNLSIVTISSTELSLEWEHPPSIDHNGIITNYEVFYVPLNTYGGLISSVSVFVPNRSAILTGLEENTGYNVSVRAYTSVGPGPYTDPVTNMTFMDVPGSPPINVSVTTNWTDQLMVTWDPVPVIHRNGPIIMYEVLYYPNNTFNGQLPPNETRLTSYRSILLTLLEEFLVYEVSVRAYTVEGPGNYSNPVSQRTLTAAPSGPVPNVTAVAVNSTSLVVRWNEVEPIDQNGIQTMYEIRFVPNTTIDGVEGGSRLTTTSRQFSLTGLEEFIVYIVSVRSFTDVGAGPYSANSTVRTIDDVPSSPPTSVRTEALSPTEISVTWDPVIDIDQNGEIIWHDVLYQPSETFDGRLSSSQTTRVFAPVMNLILANLEEFLMYNVSVRAATIRGPGPFSEAVYNTTQPSLPASPPLNVNVTTVSSSAIRVTWEAPDPIHHNGLINQYDINLNQSRFTEIPPLMSVLNASSSGVNVRLVMGLEEDVSYTVCVMAMNSVGAGPCSGLLTETTFEDRPTAPPRNLTANAAGPTNLSLAWSNPLSIHINGELTQYRVQYSRVDSDDTNQFNVSDPTVTTAVLNDLGNFTCYNILISAYTRVGEGPIANETGCTKENVPGEAPIVTEVRSNSFESILIQWQPPQNKLFGILRKFTVRYMNTDLPNPQFVYIRSIPSANRSFIIDELIQFTNYNVELAAVTIGDGEFSDPRTVRTDQDKPDGSPVEIQFPQLPNPRSLQVTWGEVPRSVRNGIITRYDITYQPLENYGGQIGPGTETTTVRMVTLSGLEEYTEYNVSIRAHTVVGAGPFSQAVTGRTSEGTPSVAPPGLRVNETGSRNMTILWDSVPLIHRNGEIVQYKLSYAPVNEELIEAIVNAADGMLFRAIDLIPGTLYSIKVAAFTSQGGSTFSDDINPRTLEESPGEVSNLNVVERFTSITVEWEMPLEPNGVISEYDLAYNKTLTELVTIDNIRPLTGITPSRSVSNLTTGQTVTIRVRAYTRIGPGPYVTMHVTTRDKPPEVTGLTVNYAESEEIATVEWSRLTGVDAEDVVQYKIVYSTESEPSDLSTVYVEASEGSRRIEGLLSDTKYLFRVLAIARIDNDTIEGDLSIINHDSFLAVQATETPLETSEVQLGISIPIVVILTVIVCVIVFFVYLKSKQCYDSKKKSNPSLQFEEGHYESVEMIRRQLPNIPVGPPTLSGHSTSAVQLNASYRAVTQDQQIEDIYDNDDQAPLKVDRYSTVQVTTPTAKHSLRALPPKGTAVIANMETYDTVDHQTEQPVQDVYDNDPFEKDQLLVRKNSNPNIYSDVGNASSAKSSKLDTSLVVSNPAHKVPPPQPKPYKSLPLKKPSLSEPPPTTEDTGSNNSGEVYEAMASTTDLVLSPSSTIVNGDIGAAKQEDKVDTSLLGKKAEVSEHATKKEPESIEGGASTGAKPYFEFNDEYDTIIHEASMEAKTEEIRDDVKKEPDSIDGATSTETKDKAPYFEFNDEYDTIIHEASMEAKAGEAKDDVKEPKSKEYLQFSEEYDTIIQAVSKEGAGSDKHEGGELETYMDMSGEQASRVE